jgi:hypothetical protein
MRGYRAMFVWMVLTGTSAAGLQVTLDRRAIEEAIFIAHSPNDFERRQFHATYRHLVGRPPIDWIDVITPFHRVEIAAEKSARGRVQFGQREAYQILGAAPSRIELLVEMTFHPLNTFVGVPSYDVELIASESTRVRPLRVDRFPRVTPRAETFVPDLPPSVTAPGTRQPVLGGTLLASFEGSSLNPQGRYEAVVLDGTTELGRSTLDLGRMR